MIVALIPARGGSKGVRRKNLAVVAGEPLVLRACRIATQAGAQRVIVTTDDPEIRGLCELWSYEVWDRPEGLATDEASVDDVVRWAARRLSEERKFSLVPEGWGSDRNGLLVVQPTVPQIDPRAVRCFLDDWWEEAPGEAWVMGVEHRHIMWDASGPLTSRRQRQESGRVSDELGVRVYPLRENPGEPSFAWTVAGPVVDIDTPADLAAVRAVMDRRKVVFRFVANEQTGWGHLRRCEALALELQHHDIRFEATPDTDRGAWDWLTGRGWPVASSWPSADVYVKDSLDEDWVPDRYGTPWVALEDHGPSARHADLVINAMYPTSGAHNEVSGARWAVLRPEFRFAPDYTVGEGRRVLASFGGTDPARLTEKTAAALRGVTCDLRIITPPGRPVDLPGVVADPSMAQEMLNCDLLICSGGRTLFEAAALGVPAVVLAQNPREATHSHLGEGNGNVYLGLGVTVEDARVQAVVHMLLSDVRTRRDLSVRARGSVDGRGVDRIVHRIEGVLRGD